MAAAGAPKRPTSAVYCEIDGLPVELDLRELNTAGLFVLTPMPPPEGSEVEVFVRLGEVRVSTTGSVVQSVSCERATVERRKPGYGLLFTSLDDAGRAELRRGIDALRGSGADGRRSMVEPAPPVKPSSPAARQTAANPLPPVKPSSPAARQTAANPLPPVKPSSPAARQTAANPLPPVKPSSPAARQTAANPLPPVKPSSPAARQTAANPLPPVERRSSPEPAAPVKPLPAAMRRTGPNHVLSDPEPEPLVFVPKGVPRANLRSEAPTSPWWNEDELKLLDELRAELASTQIKTPWAILGVSQGVDAVEAKAAFHRAAKRYHPHLFARYAHPAIQQVVTELFIAHKRAFTSLTKTGRGPRAR